MYPRRRQRAKGETADLDSPSPGPLAGVYSRLTPTDSRGPGRAARTCCRLFLFVIPALAAAGEKAAATVNGEAITAAELDAAVGHSRRSMPRCRPPRNNNSGRTCCNCSSTTGSSASTSANTARRWNRPRWTGSSRPWRRASRRQGKTIDAYLKECGLTASQVKENFLRMLQLARYTEAKATDAELRSYFEANRDFFDKTTVRTSHIVLRLPATATPAERQKAKEKLRAIRADLAAEAGRVRGRGQGALAVPERRPTAATWATSSASFRRTSPTRRPRSPAGRRGERRRRDGPGLPPDLGDRPQARQAGQI